MSLIGADNAEKIWNFLIGKIGNPYGVAGLMGNLNCESGLNSKNLEDQYATRYGFTDDSYTKAVDDGTYQNFVHDAFGYGLAQWTWWTRKEGLLKLAKSRSTSIGDLETQLEFLIQELNSAFSPVLKDLKNAKTVSEASDSVLLKFEAPLNQSQSVKNTRAASGQKIFDRFKSNTSEVKSKMGYYKVAKGSNKKLSEDFSSREFDCHGGGCCSQTLINEKLVEYLQKIRNYFKTSVTITSGYRCPTHNKRVGGATASRHSLGDAADIVVAGHSPAEVARYAESIGILGIGLYETAADGYFVHIDTRDYKSFWYGQKQAARTTFGGKVTPTGAITPTTSIAASSVLKYGSRGEAVKTLQKNLISLGYSCGAVGADGVYGLGTKQAVKNFQKDQKFSIKDQDGIYGSKTAEALRKALKTGIKANYKVTASVLNVREKPDASSRVIGSLPKDTQCYIEKIENGWGKTTNGWVSMTYLKKL